MAWRSLRAACQALVRWRLNLRVEGIESIPSSGPAIVAARHFHHLYDGVAMLATVPRPVHILVALDWIENRPGRLLMERACQAASWPIVMRRDGPASVEDGDAALAFRRALNETMALLSDGRVLLVFPEGYPNIDPSFTPKSDESSYLPFRPGFVRLARLAAEGGMHVPIIPAGFSYRRGSRWQVRLRFGDPLIVQDRHQEGAILREIESRVGCLSAKE